MFLTNFKYSNFDFDKLIYRQDETIIYVDAYYIPSVQFCPFCESSKLYKIRYKTKTVKHCTNYTWLYIVKK